PFPLNAVLISVFSPRTRLTFVGWRGFHRLYRFSARICDIPAIAPVSFGLIYRLMRACGDSREGEQWVRKNGAVGTGIARRPRTDPGEQNYRTGLLPWVMTWKRTSGRGWRSRAGGNQMSVSLFMLFHVSGSLASPPKRAIQVPGDMPVEGVDGPIVGWN